MFAGFILKNGVLWALAVIFHNVVAVDVSTKANQSNGCNNTTCQFAAPPVEAMSRLLPSTGDGIVSNETRHPSASNLEIVTTSSPSGLSAYSKFVHTSDKNTFAPSPFLGMISEVKTHAQGISVGEILPDTIGDNHSTRNKLAFFGPSKPVYLQSELQVITAKPSISHETLYEKTPEHQHLADASYNLKELKTNVDKFEIKSHTEPLLHAILGNSQLKQNDYHTPDLSTYNVKDIIDLQKYQEIRGKPDIMLHPTESASPELKQNNFQAPVLPSFPFKDLKQYKYQQNFETRDKPDSFFNGFDTLHMFKGNDYKLPSESLFNQPSTHNGDGYHFERPIGVVESNTLPDYHRPVFQVTESVKPIKEETYEIDPKYTLRPPAKSYGVSEYEGHGHGYEGHHPYDSTHLHYGDDSSFKWKSVFRFLATIIPFGMLVAALSPSILVVNPSDGGYSLCGSDGGPLFTYSLLVEAMES
uniref:Uncharacterized protein n=1 Tax=Rhodnius prolixus TaxID=13249 RepID=T1HST3_RHOPR